MSFFYWKKYAYSIDIVFEVVKEFLYTVFFGFTKPIKRPSEMNCAPDIYLSMHNTPLYWMSDVLTASDKANHRAESVGGGVG